MSIFDVLVAVAIGLVIFWLGLWAVRMLAAPPPEQDPSQVVPVQADYRCSVCGTRVTMTHAPDDQPAPPRHCREPMEPV